MKRSLTLIILLLLCILSARAGRYPFVRASEAALRFPGGRGAEYNLFASKMDSLIGGRDVSVNVLHIGGSHVQAGIWGDRLRTRFLSLRYGMDGGRGLVFPFAAGETNTPSSYTSRATGNWEYSRCVNADRPMGLCGAAATALDTTAHAAIDLLTQDRRQMKQHYCFNSVSVFGYGEMTPVVLLENKDTLRGTFDGSLWRFCLPYYRDWINIGFEGHGTYTVEGIYLDKSQKGFTYNEAGINGASTSSWLDCSHFEEQLGVCAPDLLILSIGINDIQGWDFDVAAFKDNYRQIINAARKANPSVAVLFTGINDSSSRKRVNPHTAAAERAFRDLAAEYHGAFWDMYAVMGGYGSIERWQQAGLAKGDLVHFTRDGYRLLGDMMFDAILDTLQ